MEKSHGESTHEKKHGTENKLGNESGEGKLFFGILNLICLSDSKFNLPLGTPKGFLKL